MPPIRSQRSVGAAKITSTTPASKLLAIADTIRLALGLVFIVVAFVSLFMPSMNLAGHGLDFDSFNVAGRAEVRAYYFGTALSVAGVLCFCPARLALMMMLAVLGGFSSARILGYVVDGVDADPKLQVVQHTMFGAELVGTIVAAALLLKLPADDE